MKTFVKFLDLATQWKTMVSFLSLEAVEYEK
jgi:hypothetical protein